MKQVKKISAFLFSAIVFISCKKEIQQTDEIISSSKTVEADGLSAKKKAAHVYTLSNQVSGNKVLDYTVSPGGMLALAGSYAAGGSGTGGGLGNQGAVIITHENDVLLAVNPGSNTISSFKITSSGLNLKSTVSSGGMLPTSITEHDGVVYVLNAGGDGNISGFHLGNNDKLTPIANSTRSLSSSAAGAAQVSFVRDGKVLVITEKVTNKIITYRVNDLDVPGMMHSITSATPTPFGFAVGQSGNIYVSEAVGGAPGASTVSSYHIADDGSISVVDASVSAGQTAACWVALSKDGNYAYATNTGSNSISSFNVNPLSGNLSNSEAVAGNTQMGPIDVVVSEDADFLYVLNAVSHSISVFRVGSNGSLTHLQDLGNVPAGATGLAAR